MSAHRTAVDQNTLIFKVRDSAPLQALVDPTDEAEPDSSLRGVIKYIAEHRERGAKLSPLYRDAPALTSQHGDLIVSVAHGSKPAHVPGGVNHLRLASSQHAAEIRQALERDGATIEYVHAPVLFEGVQPASFMSNGTLAGWELGVTGFRRIWPVLDAGGDYDPIAVIDNGNDGLDNVELSGRVTPIPPLTGTPSFATHASMVAGHIAANRKPVPGQLNPSVDGCCSAHLRVYNAWTADGAALTFSYETLHAALEEVARERFPVVNLSLSAPTIDPTTEEMIKNCIRQGVVVVAAMGNFGDSVQRFPAAVDGVVAVGATTPSDDWWPGSSFGNHILLAAPGQSIWTVNGSGSTFATGTSVAAAMVSAAVWLARKYARKCGTTLDVDGVRNLLQQSVDTGILSRATASQVGAGRLDMIRMAAALGCPGAPYVLPTARRPALRVP